jgi:hypothetical protein
MEIPPDATLFHSRRGASIIEDHAADSLSLPKLYMRFMGPLWRAPIFLIMNRSHNFRKGRCFMKSMGKMWIVIVGITLLGWTTAGAGTDRMMDDKMENPSQGMMKDSSKGMMDDKMGAKDATMGDDEAMMDKQKPARTATLKGSDGHHAAGTVTFGTGMDGKPTLTLSDIKVDKIPDGYVYLTQNADRMHGVALGKLKQFSGTVSFDLPAGVMAEDYDSVVIWCKKFNVEIGRAWFKKEKM